MAQTQEKISVNKQAARISFSRAKSEGIPTRQTDSLERMPMMHEEQKSGMSWNAQKNAREGKKKRLVVVLGEAGEQKGALLRGCGNLVVVAFGILARRDQPVANSKMGFQSFFILLGLFTMPCRRSAEAVEWAICDEGDCFLLDAFNSLLYTRCCVHAIFYVYS
jgi:hypothetical protein